MKTYELILSTETVEKLSKYKNSLEGNADLVGGRFKKILSRQNPLRDQSLDLFTRLLIQTKQPQIFAESDIVGDGSDWNQIELSILGDICVSVSVSIYDNGAHTSPVVHVQPFQGYLLFVPGALLRSSGSIPSDLVEVTQQGKLDEFSYHKLYERRLLPVLLRANAICEKNRTKGFITIPGIGCGQFAGPYIGWLGQKLNTILKKLLTENQHRLHSIDVVYFDPYEECANERETFGHINYFVRPLKQGNFSKSQLSTPAKLQEAHDEFSSCLLFSVVAWDHVSWPGNDFYIGARLTDDGVKAAATDLMYKITGVRGSYCTQSNRYIPPPSYKNWEDVVEDNGLNFGMEAEILEY